MVHHPMDAMKDIIDSWSHPHHSMHAEIAKALRGEDDSGSSDEHGHSDSSSESDHDHSDSSGESNHDFSPSGGGNGGENTLPSEGSGASGGGSGGGSDKGGSDNGGGRRRWRR